MNASTRSNFNKLSAAIKVGPLCVERQRDSRKQRQLIDLDKYAVVPGKRSAACSSRRHTSCFSVSCSCDCGHR